MWQTLIFSLLGTVAGSSLVALAAKKWIEHQYEKALEKHKTELNHKSELELAEFKHKLDLQASERASQLQTQNELTLGNYRHKLELAAAEQNFRFSHVFKDTSETIVETYKKLLEFQKAVNSYIDGAAPLGNNPKQENLAQNMKDKWIAFSDYYFPRKIFVPKQTAERIRIFANSLDSLIFRFHTTAAAERQLADFEAVENVRQKFEKSREEIPPLLNALEDDFQRILGFPTTPEQKPN